MLAGHAAKILPQVPAEPRGCPAEPGQRALRSAAASPEPLALEPPLGRRRSGDRDVLRSRARALPDADRGDPRGSAAGQPARGARHHAVYQSAHDRAALRARVLDRHLARAGRGRAPQPSSGIRLVELRRLVARAPGMVALARQAPRRGARRPRGRPGDRRLRRRAARLARARGPRLAQAQGETCGNKFGIVGADWPLHYHRSILISAVHRSTLVLLALVLVACTTQKQSDFVDAAATPLSDLNVVHAEIPAVLLEAQKEPYSVPSDQSCVSLKARVRALDEVLGPDLDAPASASNPGLVERGTSAAGTTAVGALRHTAEGVVPFRGWVRKLSGAERYSKQVAAAIAAGTARRAFLKGLGVSKECP